MRIIHTGDVHLDRCFAEGAYPTGFGNRRRQRLRDVFAGILDRAKVWPADAVLIAGDLFDLERVSRDTVEFLRRAFEDVAPIPVFIAPGNHDPYVPTSPYAMESWPANVTIFSDPAWAAREVNGIPLTVHGFAFDGPDISVNPFGTLIVPENGRTHIAVGHGSERGHQPPDRGTYASFAAEDATPVGLAYLALGHFHSFTPIEGPFDTRVCYSGAPEGLGFGELGPHHYLEVIIDEAGVAVAPVRSCWSEYVLHSLDVSEYTTVQEIVEALRALPQDAGLDTLCRVTLTGLCAPEIREQIPSLDDTLSGTFAFLDIVDDTMPAEDYEDLAREDTSLGDFVKQLNEEIRDAADDDTRRLLQRAREVGLATYRGQGLPIRGVEDA
jgi:DNA repair exonuclease SbcCD nuclease subunit